MRGASTRLLEKLFWFAIIFSVFYLSYRYPFHFNSASTSPTYSNTPMLLQIGKYAVMLIIIFASIIIGFTKKLRHEAVIYVLLLSMLFVYPFSKFILFHDIALPKFLFWSLSGLILAALATRVNEASISNAIKKLVYISIAVDVIQMFLFLFFARLPALAYAGTLSVRFGSFLDAPNSFAGICFLLLGWAYHHYAGIQRTLFLFFITMMLVLTQSFTAIIFFLGLCFVLLLWRLLTKSVLFITTIFSPLVVFILIGIAVAVYKIYDFFIRIISLKNGSIEAHADIISALHSMGISGVLLGHPFLPYRFFESWWGAAIVNFGVIWALLFFLFLLVPLLRLVNWYSIETSRTNRSVYLGIILFYIYFLIGSFNLPIFEFFPNNFLFFSMVSWIMFRRRGLDSVGPIVSDSAVTPGRRMSP